MKSYRLSGWSLLPFVVISLMLLSFSSASCNQAGAPEVKAKPRFIAYYFYTNKRCGPCKRIEQWAREAIAENFKDQIEAGRLQWQAINVEKPENKHFIKDFQLFTKSVVIAEYKDGKPVRWQNLENVWQLYRDREKYFDYLARETGKFMEKS